MSSRLERPQIVYKPEEQILNFHSPSGIHFSLNGTRLYLTGFGETIGGSGITSRNLSELDGFLPGIKERLKTEKGHIVFVGNGLSLAPLELRSNIFQKKPKITVIDIFDYHALAFDLLTLKEEILQLNLPTPIDLNDKLDTCLKLVDGITKENITAIKHTFQTDSKLPVNLNYLYQTADLVVNVFGPPPSTVMQQLSLLKSGGEFYMNPDHTDPYMFRELPDGFTFRSSVVNGVLVRVIYRL